MNTKNPDAASLYSGSEVAQGWQIAWAQLTGTRHSISEDRAEIRVLAGDEQGQPIYLGLADGVGGGSRGEVAAQALALHAVGLPEDRLGQSEQIADWMEGAEETVQTALRAVTFAPGAATLAAAWLQADGRGHLLRVGDARIYQVDADGARALTRDQTYAHTSQTPPLGARLEDCACMVGTGYMGTPEIEPLTLPIDACLLLCSDGLHRSLHEGTLHAALYGPRPNDKLEVIANRLVEAARRAGSDDDISVIIARHRSVDPQRPWWRCFFSG